uniref:Bulb-type lectin domain-containing protein n=1 Tax=Araucaria cunninghamii TaxID=56994 RepID=A0A0D6QUA7_ARACU
MAMAIALVASSLFPQFWRIYLVFLLMRTAGAQQPQKHRFTLVSTLDTSPSSKWISLSGEFAFGFYKTNPSGQYLLGVWFDNISTKTLVWTANRDGPVEKDATLELSATGIQLFHSKSTVRRIPELAVATVAAAEMRDNGNFVLLDASDQPVWQSFDYPTDTMLPGQTIMSPYTLYSRAKNANYSTGRFVLSFQKNGDLRLVPAERVADDSSSYWSFETGNDGMHPYNLNFGKNGILSLVDASNKTVVWHASIWNGTGRAGQFPRRVTLDADGILRGYVWKGDGASSWTSQWQALYDPCEVNGQCGLNGICQMIHNSLACTCPPGFDFLDSNDHLKGCSRDPSQQICGAKSIMQAIGNTDWSGNDYASMTSVNETACKQACIEDCMCVVVVYGLVSGEELCWKKAMPLRNGRTGADRLTFVKVVPEPSRLQPSKNSKVSKERGLVAIAIALLFCSAALAAFSLIFLLRGRRLRPKEQPKVAEGL